MTEKEKLLHKKLSRCKTDQQKMKVMEELANYCIKEDKFIYSKEWGEKLLELAQKHHAVDYLSKAYHIIGTSYYGFDMFDTSLEYLLKSLELAKQITSNNVEISTIINTISLVYANLKDFKKVVEWLEEGYQYSPDNTIILINFGIRYYNDEEYDKALLYLKKAEESALKKGNKLLLSVANTYMAYYYLKNSDFPKALELFQSSLECKYNGIDHFHLAKTYAGMSIVYSALNKKDEAEFALVKAIEFVDKIPIKGTKKEGYYLLCETYEQLNNTKQALSFHKKYSELKDEIFSSKLAHNLAQIQESYEREKRELVDTYQKKLTETEKDYQIRLEKLQQMYGDIIGLNHIGFFSDKMDEIHTVCEKLHNDRTITVLIEGETGTGKEIIARLIHFGKDKSSSPFICINCSAISPSLFESELFGYEGGAYTGSKGKGMPGKLELAQGGTLFLDEIGDLPLDMQPKLLRVLQEKEFYRIGGVKKIKTDVRIICATNHDLSGLIKDGRFRKDLWYRLNVGHIKVPPLRERKEEIIPLAQLFLKKFAEQKKKDFQSISKDAAFILQNQDWEGNIRELENTIERAVVLHNGKTLQEQHLRNILTHTESAISNDLYLNFNDEQLSLSEIELQVINHLLNRFNGNKTKTAEYLGITRKTLRLKLNKSES